jgi:hypothetical protein
MKIFANKGIPIKIKVPNIIITTKPKAIAACKRTMS